jgi:hypothetical protein
MDNTSQMTSQQNMLWERKRIKQEQLEAYREKKLQD